MSCLSAVVPHFAREVEEAVNALSSRPPGYVDENEFIEASRLVYDGVREIRRAVLMNRVRKTFYLVLPLAHEQDMEDILFSTARSCCTLNPDVHLLHLDINACPKKVANIMALAAILFMLIR